MTKGFIRYENKNGIEYASHYKAKRIGPKKTNDIEYLGRVVDKEKGVYLNKKRGTFLFSLDDCIKVQLPTIVEKLILDFGDSYLLGEILKKTGFKILLDGIFRSKSDTVLALLFHKVLHGGANCYAQVWWEGAYARILFPKASLQSQRVSEILMELGDEFYQRAFFKEYLRYISSKCGRGILVDSTGLPNDIRFPLTAINNHNGVISNEARLILVMDRQSGMPIYFRYTAGNIVDVSTLETTLNEVRAYGVDVEYAIVDAGYFSEKNIKELQSRHISFVMRMIPNRRMYKELVKAHAVDLEDAKYLVKYRERFVYIKRIVIDLFGKDGYAYIAEDIDRKHDEIKKYISGALNNNDISTEDMNAEMREKGIFILVSSDKIDVNEILPLYYTRQAIEQVFDFGKNCVDLLPLRVHGIEAFRGHLLLSFMASTIYIMVNNMLKKADVSATGAFNIFRNLKCKVYEENIIVMEANKKMNDIAKRLNFTFPSVLSV